MRVLLSFAVLLLAVFPARSTFAQDPSLAGSVEILEPAEWRGEGTRGIAVQSGRSIRVVGVARHRNGVQRVLINGLRATIAPDPTGGTRFIGYLHVDPRLTDVEVAVYPFDDQPMVRGFGVRPEPAPASAQVGIAEMAATSGFRGKRWAVIVGISEYRDQRIPSLRFADADARAIYGFLTSDAAGLGGFDPENVLLLENEDATFRNLRTALFDFLKGPTEDDIVLIYFAGHGAPDPERPEELYLLPYDTDVDAVAGTALPMEDVTAAVRRTYARDMIVITDACHSAGVGGQTGLRDLNLNQINQSFLQQLQASTGGIAVFTASEASQLSREGEEWGGGHGIFTWKILEALRGHADDDGDRVVSLGEMMEYVRDQVRRETRNAQIPTIGQTAFDRSWPMAIVLDPTTVTAVETVPQPEMIPQDIPELAPVEDTTERADEVAAPDPDPVSLTDTSGTAVLSHSSLVSRLATQDVRLRVATMDNQRYVGLLTALGPGGVILEVGGRAGVNLSLESIARVEEYRPVTVAGLAPRRQVFQWVEVWPAAPEADSADDEDTLGRRLRLIDRDPVFFEREDSLVGNLLSISDDGRFRFVVADWDTVGVFEFDNVRLEHFSSNTKGTEVGLAAGLALMTLTAIAADCFLDCFQLAGIPLVTGLVGTIANRRGWDPWEPELCEPASIHERAPNGAMTWIVGVTEPGSCLPRRCVVEGAMSETEAIEKATRAVAVRPSSCWPVD